jgi:hypothetical protein
MIVFWSTAAASMEDGTMNHSLRLGDLSVTNNGEMGRIVDIDPEDRNTLLVERVHVVRVGRDSVEVVERASLLRRFIMQAHAFFLWA